METQTNDESVDTSPTDVNEYGYPTGVLDTPFGKLVYHVYCNKARIFAVGEVITINRVEYKLDVSLTYGKRQATGSVQYVYTHHNSEPEGTIEDWHRKSDESNSIRFADWKRNCYPSESARNKEREIVLFLCNWLNANPDLLNKARRNFLMKGMESIAEDERELREKADQRDRDGDYMERCLDEFDAGDSLDWEALRILIDKA